MLNPFALPVHPAIVHFPVALLALTWGCVVLRHATGEQVWDGRASLFEVIGVVALAPTIVAGFIDTRGFDFLLNPRADAPLIWHMTSGLVAAIAFTSHYFLRRREQGLAIGPDIALASFGMIALLSAGLLAGEMVYGT